MGYFANATEGDIYEGMYCDHCVHNLEEYGCPCLDAHMMWNYDECNNKDSILHKMIPRGEENGNLQCLFYKRSHLNLKEPI